MSLISTAIKLTAVYLFHSFQTVAYIFPNLSTLSKDDHVPKIVLSVFANLVHLLEYFVQEWMRTSCKMSVRFVVNCGTKYELDFLVCLSDIDILKSTPC
jgi:hypothetical protein